MASPPFFGGFCTCGWLLQSFSPATKAKVKEGVRGRHTICFEAGVITQSDPCQIDMHGRADQKLQHVLFDLVGVVELLRSCQRHGVRVRECAGANFSEHNANTIQNLRRSLN